MLHIMLQFYQIITHVIYFRYSDKVKKRILFYYWSGNSCICTYKILFVLHVGTGLNGLYEKCMFQVIKPTFELLASYARNINSSYMHSRMKDEKQVLKKCYATILQMHAMLAKTSMT